MLVGSSGSLEVVLEMENSPQNGRKEKVYISKILRCAWGT